MDQHNSYPLKDWNFEHMQKTIVKYVSSITQRLQIPAIEIHPLTPVTSKYEIFNCYGRDLYLVP
jgi:hypothetical protein